MYGNGMIRGALRRPAPSPAWFGPVALAAVAAAAAGALVTRSPAFAGVVVGAVVVVTYFGETARRPLGEVLIVAMIATGGIVDILQRVDAGAASGQAVVTVVLVGAAILVCLTGLSVPSGEAGRAIYLLALFVSWALVSFTWGTISTQGLQNVLVYVAALLLTLIAATVARFRPGPGYDIVSKAFWVTAVVGLGLYAVSLPIGGPGTGMILSPRPFGLLGMVLVAWFMGAGLAGRRWAYWVVGAAMVLTLLSLSRSALAAQFALVALARFDLRSFRGWTTAVGAAIVTLAVALCAVFFYAPLHHRFFHGDTQTVGGFSINVTGRDALWSANWGWFKHRPVIGHGAGASDRMTATLPDHGAGHPHNDYLRILVDYGVIGLVLWLAAFLALLRHSWRRWNEVRGTGTAAEHIHASAFLVLIGLALTMIVDNPLIEVTKMGPIAVILGLSLGLPAMRRTPAGQYAAAAAEPVGAPSE
jgi:O-antigen ligase